MCNPKHSNDTIHVNHGPISQGVYVCGSGEWVQQTVRKYVSNLKEGGKIGM